MSAMSNYLEDALVNFVLRNNPDTFTSPGTTVYVGLIEYYDAAVVEAGTLTQEVTGNGYTRIQVDGGTTGGWAAASNGATQNNDAITFPTATGDWNGISGVIISNHATAGNVLLHGALTTARDVKSGDVFKFNAGDLDVTFA